MPSSIWSRVTTQENSIEHSRNITAARKEEFSRNIEYCIYYIINDIHIWLGVYGDERAGTQDSTTDASGAQLSRSAQKARDMDNIKATMDPTHMTGGETEDSKE